MVTGQHSSLCFFGLLFYPLYASAGLNQPG